MRSFPIPSRRRGNSVAVSSRRNLLACLLACSLASAAAGQGIPAQPRDRWVFEPFDGNVLDYYETHTTDAPATTITLTVKRDFGTGSGTVRIKALAESTAFEGIHYDLPVKAKTYTANDNQLTFELTILHRGKWFTQKWLWLEITRPFVPATLPGARALIGIRPDVPPPSIDFVTTGTTLAAGTSTDVEVRLDAISDENVFLHYSIEAVTPGALFHFTVPASGSLKIPRGTTQGFIQGVAAGASSSGQSIRIALDYENADGSDTNLFFGTHSWRHTNTEALGVDGTPSFAFPGDEQGFMVGGWCDSGYESDFYEQQDPAALEHFDGSGPVVGVVVDEDARVAPYVRADSELLFVEGPDSLVTMKNYQELVLYVGEFVGVDAMIGSVPRTADRFRASIRARTADITHALEIVRGGTSGDFVFMIDGTSWAVNKVLNIHDDDEIVMGGIDHGDGFGVRPYLIYRHVTDPTEWYDASCGTGCAQEDANDRANVILTPHVFSAPGGCATPVPATEVGRGNLFYGVSYRTMDADPRGQPLPRFWERKGLWPEPRGGARMDTATTLEHTIDVP